MSHGSRRERKPADVTSFRFARQRQGDVAAPQRLRFARSERSTRPLRTFPRVGTVRGKRYQKGESDCSFMKVHCGNENAVLRELKNRLSEYVREIRSGEAALATDRGEIVAELIEEVPRL